MKRTTMRMVLIPLVLLTATALAVGACSAGSDEEAAAPSAAEPAPAEPAPADLGTEESGGAGGQDAQRGTAAEAAPPAEPAAETPAADSAVPISGQVPPIQPRVIQNASLSVTVPRDDFEETVDQARQIATTLGGFVTSSSASQGGDDRLVSGTLVVRVPGQAYSQAMSQFAKLGKVVGREESGSDVSLQYVDLEARAKHLEAVERQLLGFLDETKTVGDALVVQQQLNDVQLQLEEVRGQLRYLDDQTSFATISLQIAERGVPVAKPGDDSGWSLADAWHAAANGFEAIIGGALVVLVTAGPILVALALAFFAGRAFLRRRKPTRPGGPAETPTA
jgi:hypothetical protein